jgi:drug/metabolite transporter (DMT)-like permease
MNALVYVFLTAIISGFSIFINKFGVAGINSSVFTFSKNVVVALMLLSLIALAGELGKFRALSKKHWGKLLAIGFFGGSIPFLLFFAGLQLTTAANATFIHKLMFIFVVILATVLLKERLSKKIFIASVLLIAGNFLLFNFNLTFGIGEYMILLATLFWAVETVISKHALNELSPRTVAFGRMFFGSLFILGYLGLTGETALITTLTLEQLAWVFLTASFLFLYVFTWYTGLKSVKASLATSILLLGTVITSVLNFTFSGQNMTWETAVGIFLILMGVMMLIGASECLSSMKSIVPVASK